MMHSRYTLVLALCVSYFCSRPATSLVPPARRPRVKEYRYVAASRIATRKNAESDIEEVVVQQVKPAEAYSKQVFEEPEQDVDNQDVNSENGSSESLVGNDEEESERTTKGDFMMSTKTLYDVLGASPDATRDELKRLYVTLARETHPDAIVGKSAKEREEAELLFGEVAAAWRILSDKKERKRYDRSLKAKAFTQEVEKMAGAYAEKMSTVLEQVGLSFLRNKADTTVASINAAAMEVEQTEESENKMDLGYAFGELVKAGQEVSRTIDRHLLKKSRELDLE